MNNDTTKIESKQVFSKFIFVDSAYQRVLNPNYVKSIVAEFDPLLVNPPKLSLRDGKYYVFDGQHTIAALKTINGGKDIWVNCRIYHGLTREMEAKLFSEQNGIAHDIRCKDKLRSLLSANDPAIKDFFESTARAGFSIDFSSFPSDWKIIAVAKAYKLYRSLTPAAYADLLLIIKEAWAGSKDSLRQEILGGMLLFYQTYVGRFNRDKLAKQLSQVNPKTIIRDGKAMYGSNDKRYARQILATYNKNKKVARLSDEL